MFILNSLWGYMQEEECVCVLFIIVFFEYVIEDLWNFFQENDYFGFELDKVKGFNFFKDSFVFFYQILF